MNAGQKPRGTASVRLIGELAADPDFRTQPGEEGKTVCIFRVRSFDRYRRRGTEEWIDREDIHPLVAFGHVGEALRHRTRGQAIYVEGALRSREYTRRDKTTGTSYETVASLVVLFGPVQAIGEDAG